MCSFLFIYFHSETVYLWKESLLNAKNIFIAFINNKILHCPFYDWKFKWYTLQPWLVRTSSLSHGQIALALEGTPAVWWDAGGPTSSTQVEVPVEGVEPWGVLVVFSIVVAHVPGIDFAAVSHQHRPHTQTASMILKPRVKGEGRTSATLQRMYQKNKHFPLYMNKNMYSVCLPAPGRYKTFENICPRTF